MAFAKCDYYYYYNSSYAGGIPTTEEKSGSFSSSFFPTNFLIINGKISLPTPATVKANERNIPISENVYFPSSGTAEIVYVKDSIGEDIPGEGFFYSVSSGTYTVRYNYYESSISVDASFTQQLRLTYTFSVFENHYPLKKYTILDVINRTCETVEPLRYGQKPRFRLQGVTYDSETGSANGYIPGTIAEKFDKILAPEFAFTKMNLREMLQQVGGYIHGEPRVYNIGGLDSITPQDIYFEFTFDDLGGGKKAYLKKNYVTATFGTDVNEYCTSLDSSVDNIVNQISYAQGVTVSPFYGTEGISLRVDTTTLRVEENENSHIPTALPINQLGGDYKLYCTYIPGYGSQNLDITPYVFEEADYKNLSSYEGTFPYCKAYAIYYTQGQPNVKGLFFKNDNVVSTWFQEYAIVNIIAQVLGVDASDVKGKVTGNYGDLAFRVEYNPIFKERIRTNKPVLYSGLPRTIAYNQSANLLESRHLGEHLKGVVARLGNVAKTYTYNVAFLSDIPQVGMRFDDNYIISTVSTKFLPTYIQVTIALTKNFNRISGYVGVNSNKRMWEVSEKQAQQRETVITDYMVFSKGRIENPEIDKYVYLNIQLKDIIQLNGKYGKPVSAVNVFRWSKKGNRLQNEITLPVVASAMGNSMSFTFGFEDNYSAGQKIDYGTDNKGNSAYWSNYVPYGDYFGRFYYLGFNLFAGDILKGTTNFRAMPSGEVTVNGVSGESIIKQVALEEPKKYSQAIKYRKDSREVPQITYEVQAVSTSEDLIIGSALMKNCSLVNLNSESTILAIFKEELNVINSDLRNMTSIAPVNYSIVDNEIIIEPTGNFTYKSWALYTNRNDSKITVEDEDGEVIEQTIYGGKELVIGGNYQLNADSPTYISMVKKSKIYD